MLSKGDIKLILGCTVGVLIAGWALHAFKDNAFAQKITQGFGV